MYVYDCYLLVCACVCVMCAAILANARVLIGWKSFWSIGKCSCLFLYVSLLSLSLKSEVSVNLLNCWCFGWKMNLMHLFNGIIWGCFDEKASRG